MTRQQAIELARTYARAKPEKYHAEPFEPHEWVVDAIMSAANGSKDDGPPQPLPCGCSTYCQHKEYPDAPLRKGLYCREKKLYDKRDDDVDTPVPPPVDGECEAWRKKFSLFFYHEGKIVTRGEDGELLG